MRYAITLISYDYHTIPHIALFSAGAPPIFRCRYATPLFYDTRRYVTPYY